MVAWYSFGTAQIGLRDQSMNSFELTSATWKRSGKRSSRESIQCGFCRYPAIGVRCQSSRSHAAVWGQRDEEHAQLAAAPGCDEHMGLSQQPDPRGPPSEWENEDLEHDALPSARSKAPSRRRIGALPDRRSQLVVQGVGAHSMGP